MIKVKQSEFNQVTPKKIFVKVGETLVPAKIKPTTIEPVPVKPHPILPKKEEIKVLEAPK